MTESALEGSHENILEPRAYQVPNPSTGIFAPPTSTVAVVASMPL
jgi:hypothetical protein